MIRHVSIIRAGLLVLAVVAGCKREHQEASPQAIPATQAPEPLPPVRPLAEFVRGAIESHFSKSKPGIDAENRRGWELLVELDGISPSDFPTKVDETKFHVAGEAEIEAALRASPGDSLSYLGVKLGRVTQEANRTLRIAFLYVQKTEGGKLDYGADSGCTYVELRSKDGYSIVRTSEWEQ